MENIEDFKEYLIAKNLSDKTIVLYIGWVKRFLKFLNGDEITKKNISIFIKEIQKIYSPNTVRCGFRIIQQFIKYKKCDFLNELSEIRLPSLEEYPRIVIKDDQYNKIQLLFDLKKWIDKRDSLIFEILFKTGLRSNEISNLSKSDILDNKIKVLGKGNKTRFIFIFSDLKKKLIDWDFEYFLVNKKGEKLSFKQLNTIVKKNGKKIDIEISPHSLRRSFCTNLIKSGCNIKVIQKMMGHKSIITTSGYIFFDEEEMLDEFKKAFKNLDI